MNRTVRRLREDRLVLMGQQVVIITDLERLRATATGIPPLAELPDPLGPAEPVRGQRLLPPGRSGVRLQPARHGSFRAAVAIYQPFETHRLRNDHAG